MSGISERRSRAILEEAKQEMSAGRYALARSRLTELVTRRPTWAEALYNLGICEQARNRPDAALEIFERVPLDSEWTGWSDVRRARLEMDRGRFTECERLLRRAATRAGPHVAEAR
jgi:tetratricopeptide (TPR) repeat protein